MIEPLNTTELPLDNDFYMHLETELCRAVGPISQILIEEAAMALGYTIAQFPRHLVAELVDFLAREIPREKKAMCFKQHMIQAIQEKGYHR